MEQNANLQIAKEIIEKIEYINIATADEKGEPWNSPVYTAYTKEYSFYWASDRANVHSQNILENKKVFATVYDSTAPAGTGFGVYMKGEAIEVSNPLEIAQAIALLYGRAKDKPVAIEIFMRHFPRRIYKFVPETVWVNGDGTKDGDYVDIRTKIPLLST